MGFLPSHCERQSGKEQEAALFGGSILTSSSSASARLTERGAFWFTGFSEPL